MGGIICKMRVNPVNNEGYMCDSDSDNEITNNLLPSEIMEREYLKKTTRKQSTSEIFLRPSQILKIENDRIAKLRKSKNRESEIGIA
tara:strand:- start:361 stop:621 length:261 start_codon:yes stop_codon:yes gene_type:complete